MKLFRIHLLTLIGLLFSMDAMAYDFQSNGLFYSISSPENLKAKVVQGEQKYSGDVVIPAKVEFEGKTYTVETIGKCAFYQCTDITSVDFGDTRLIEDSAFYGCTAIKSIDFKNVQEIETSAFTGCTDLRSVDFRDVKTVGMLAFSKCTGIESLDLKNVETLMPSAFSECSGITSINLGHVENISMHAFLGCTGITSVNMNNVQRTGQGIFYGCKNLKSIDFGNMKTTGYMYTFSGCEGLTSIDLKNISTIGAYTFSGCKNLTDVDLKNVKEIGIAAFEDCKKIKSIRTSNKNAAEIKDGTFAPEVYSAVLTVPAGSADNYRYAPVWSNFYNIEESTDMPAGIKSASAEHLSVTGTDGQIIVEGAEKGNRIRIFTTDGTLVKDVRSNGKSKKINVVKNNVYIVKIGKDTFKLSL